ncbi:MAG: NMD3-related protein [archaeon]
MNFCPVCGKDIEGNFCDEHNPVSLNYKDVLVRVCECKKYFHRNQWLPFNSLKDVVKKIAKEQIKEKVTVNPLINEEIIKKKFEIEVGLQGEQFTIPAKLQVEKCPTCSKMGTEYFESVIQLRPKDDELLYFVQKQVDNDSLVFISKVVASKQGYDVFLSSNKAALNIGRKLKKSFKGELKTSRKLFGRDNIRSKDLYRVSVCFRKE